MAAPPSAWSWAVSGPLAGPAAGADGSGCWQPPATTRASTAAARSLTPSDFPPARHGVEPAHRLDHVEVLLAVPDRELVGEGGQVELEVAVRPPRLPLERGHRAPDLRDAAAEERRGGVGARDDHDAVPVEIAVVPHVAVLDDEDAGALDRGIARAVVALEAGEGRGRVELAAEVDELGGVPGAEVHADPRAAVDGARRGQQRAAGAPAVAERGPRAVGGAVGGRAGAAGEEHRAGHVRLEHGPAGERGELPGEAPPDGG